MAAQFAAINSFFLNRHIALKEEWLRAVLQHLKVYLGNIDKLKSLVYEQWLYSDLKESTVPNFRPPVGKVFTSIAILQVNSVINVAKPFVAQLAALEKKETPDLDIFTANDDKSGLNYDKPPPERRMYRFELSDGERTIKAVEHVPNPTMGPHIIPGCKLVLTKSIYRDQIMLLTPRNCQFLGGYVKHLADRNSTKEMIKRMPLIQQNPPKELRPGQIRVDQNDRKRKNDSDWPNNNKLPNNNTNPTFNRMAATQAPFGRDQGRAAKSVETQMRPSTTTSISGQLNDRRRSVPSTSNNQPNEPSTSTKPTNSLLISAQLKTNQRRSNPPNEQPTTSSTSASATNNSISSALNNRRPAVAPSVQPRTTTITPKKPDVIRPKPVQTNTSLGLLTTPHGTNLTMDNFAVPKLQNPPKPTAQKTAYVAAITPRKPPEQTKTTPTTANSTSVRPPITTPTSARSCKSDGDDKCVLCAEMPHRCRLCQIAFADLALYTIHVGYHQQNSFTCNRCGENTGSALSFNLHIYQPH